MLAQTLARPEAPAAVTHFFNGCGYQASHTLKIHLKNRRSGELVNLFVYSHRPLDLAETRRSITEALGNHWDWRQLHTEGWHSEF